MLLSELNQQSAAEAIHNGVTALLPIGATEVHGNHLPLGTDSFLAQGVAEKTAQKLGPGRGLVLPCVHYGQVWSLRATPGTMRQVWAQCPDMKVFSFTYPGAEEVIKRVCTSRRPHKAYFHACEIETSYMLYLCPERVDMGKAICQYPEFPADFDVTPWPWTDIMDVAVMGDATAATAEKGRAIIDVVVDNIVRLMG